MLRTLLWHMTCFNTGLSIVHIPFSGTAVCCFERSSSPEHAGKRVVVVRVLGSLESDPVRPNPSYAGPRYLPELMPQEGALLLSFRHRTLKPRAQDVDQPWTEKSSNHAAPLGILFDNATEYRYP
ncbi:hypothetical protein C8T65DRAFT_650431 [Cerioporus squamosus]|nr:hypothetical protein C8T65DRAFT_650431 [Cerioporus squamosus]